jgi:predicted DsbA family dithiol-disulfide isomerase
VARIIEVFADMVCPFTHVGLRRLSEARRTAGRPIAVRVRAWPLESINGKPLAADLVSREIEGLRETVAPELFAGFDPDTFPETSIPAFGLAAAAYALDDTTGESVSLALRDALFEEGLDITDGVVLDTIGRRFGVERLRDGDAAAAVEADWERGKARHVEGSPHFFVGTRDWFCPSLEIAHQGGRYEIQVADDTLRDFYAAALD